MSTRPKIKYNKIMPSSGVLPTIALPPQYSDPFKTNTFAPVPDQNNQEQSGQVFGDFTPLEIINNLSTGTNYGDKNLKSMYDTAKAGGFVPNNPYQKDVDSLHKVLLDNLMGQFKEQNTTLNPVTNTQVQPTANPAQTGFGGKVSSILQNPMTQSLLTNLGKSLTDNTRTVDYHGIKIPVKKGFGEILSTGLNNFTNDMSQNQDVNRQTQMYKNLGIDIPNIRFKTPEELSSYAKMSLEMQKNKRENLKAQSDMKKDNVANIHSAVGSLQEILKSGSYSDQEKRKALSEFVSTYGSLAKLPAEISNLEAQADYNKNIKPALDSANLEKVNAENSLIPLKAENIKSEIKSRESKANSQSQRARIPAGQALNLSETKNGIKQLETLYTKTKKLPNNLFTPGFAQVAALNPWDTNAQAFNQLVASTKQLIGKGLEGGVLRKEDEIKYEKIIPKLGDTRATINEKFYQLNEMLKNKYNNDVQTLQQAGYNTGNFSKYGSNDTQQTKVQPKANNLSGGWSF